VTITVAYAPSGVRVRKVARNISSGVLPLTYAVNGLRDVMVKGADLSWGSLQLDVGVVAGFIVVLVVAASTTLRRRIA